MVTSVQQASEICLGTTYDTTTLLKLSTVIFQHKWDQLIVRLSKMSVNTETGGVGQTNHFPFSFAFAMISSKSKSCSLKRWGRHTTSLGQNISSAGTVSYAWLRTVLLLLADREGRQAEMFFFTRNILSSHNLERAILWPHFQIVHP